MSLGWQGRTARGVDGALAEPLRPDPGGCRSEGPSTERKATAPWNLHSADGMTAAETGCRGEPPRPPSPAGAAAAPDSPRIPAGVVTFLTAVPTDTCIIEDTSGVPGSPWSRRADFERGPSRRESDQGAGDRPRARAVRPAPAPSALLAESDTFNIAGIASRSGADIVHAMRLSSRAGSPIPARAAQS